MIVNIPEELRIIFSKIQFLTVQVDKLTKNNSNNLPINVIVPGLLRKRNELRIKLCEILEKAVKEKRKTKK